jgi:eukaryotic-like serine/threonine-protein kinase
MSFFVLNPVLPQPRAVLSRVGCRPRALPPDRTGRVWLRARARARARSIRFSGTGTGTGTGTEQAAWATIQDSCVFRRPAGALDFWVVMQLEPGMIFARDYRVIEPIAAGGMGAVYRVEQLSTLKHRALKVLHTRVFGDERARGRFIREATVGARIESAHVVEVIGAGIDEATGMPWLAMELLDGFDLGVVVRHHDTLAPREMMSVFRQLCHGLAAAHAASIVHRDLKPENVFVARSHRAGSPFTVKILDFGIAKVVRETSVATDTAVVGSPMWMAPEQINADVLSPRTDVWALGLLAFWALTGRIYWKAAHGARVTAQALFVEQLFSPIDEASVRAEQYDRVGAIPEGFDAWFAICMQREPVHRFEDASAAFNALCSVLEDVAGSTERALLPPDGWNPSAAQTRKDQVVGGHGHGQTTMEGTTGSMLGSGVPTIVGTQSSDGLEFDGGSASQSVVTHADPVTSDVAAEVPQAIASSTLVASTPRRSGPTAKLIGFVGVCAALGGAALTVAFMSGRDAKRREAAAASVSSSDGQTDETTPSLEAEEDDDAIDGLEALELEPRPKKVEVPIPSVVASTSFVTTHKATQPSFAPASLEFLGWSRDASVFVLQTAHGHEEVRGGEPANYVELIEVHDGLTGLLVESYLRKRVADSSVPKSDRLAKLAAEAEPASEWPTRSSALELLAPDPRRERVRRPGEVRVTESELPLATKMRMIPKRAGVDYVWWGVDPAGSGRDRSPLGPRLRFDLVVAEARHSLLDVRIPFSHDEVARLAAGVTAPITVDGQLRFHWAPNEDRVVLEIEGSTSTPGLQDRRWFLRAAGPQIRLIDGGVGQRVARQAAGHFADAGLPIAVVDLDYNPVERTEVYYRTNDAGGPELADRLSAALGGDVPAKPLDTGGWTAAVVLLGQDFDESRLQ